MTIALTGATGFVGGHVRSACRQRGHHVIPLTRTLSGLPDEVTVGPLEEAIIAPCSLERVDAVIHLAARTHIMRDKTADPLGHFRAINVEGTRRLLDAAIAARVPRFVFVSSIKAVAERTEPGWPVGPETEPRPEDPYGVSKLEAEIHVQTACEAAGTEWVIMRPPLVLGPGARGNLAWLAKFVEHGVPLPFAAIHNRRSVISVENLASLTVRACEVPTVANKILMVCDRVVSTPELIRDIAKNGRARLFPVPPAILRLLGRAAGASAEVDRLCGSLEIDAEGSLAALDWPCPVSRE